MDFNMDRDPGPVGQPSLSEMTAKAIQILQKNKYGFFLMVEGRIWHNINQYKRNPFYKLGPLMNYSLTLPFCKHLSSMPVVMSFTSPLN